MRLLYKFTCTFLLSTFYFIALTQQFDTHDVFVDGLYSCYGAADVKAADLDNDGDMDVIACSFSTDHIYWYENLGNKEFGPRNIIANQINEPLSVDIGDFDGDNLIDIVSISTDDMLVWYKNMGNNTFSESSLISNEMDYPNKVVASDMDNDGIIDLLTSSLFDDKLLFFKGASGGTWLPAQLIAFDIHGDDFIISDINGDNLIDIAYLTTGTRRLTYRKQTLGSNFFTGIIVDDIGGYHDLLSEDIDGDGDMDLIANRTNVNSERELVWFEKTQSDFFGVPIVLSSADYLTEELIANDIDNDGDIDIVAAADSEDEIIIYRNDGNTNFTIEVITEQVDNPKGVFFADLDNDDDMDLLSCSFSDNKVSWYENFGINNFSEQRNITYNVNSLKDFHYGDLNNDGLIDIVSASGDANVIGWYKNLGSNKFSQQKTILQHYQEVSVAHIADINNDGNADIICGGFPELLLYMNNGDETFTEKGSIFESSVKTPNKIYSLDIDNDGDIDLVISYQFDSKIHVLTNDGNGDFNSFNTIDFSPSNISDIEFSDIDEDGFQDLFFLTSNNQRIGYLKNEGNGLFSNDVSISNMLFGFNNIEVADMNNDGLNDVLSYARSGSKFAIYMNLGGGLFSDQELLPISGAINNFALGDIDQDGLIDVAAVNNGTNSISWFKNNGDKTFTLESYSNEYESCGDLQLVDLDNDNDLDILASCFIFGPVSYDNIGTLNNNLFECAETNSTTIDVTILFGESHTLADGSIVNESGIYTTPIIGENGCTTEIIITNLIVCPQAIETTEDILIFEGESYMLPNGDIVSIADTYISEILDKKNCPIEIITTVLTVCPQVADIEVMVTLSAGETHTLPNGEIVDEEGTYNVTIEDADGCPSTIVTIVTVLTSTKPIINENAIRVFPNPIFNDFIIEFEMGSEDITHISLNNPLGEIIYESKLKSNRHEMNLNGNSAGLYILNLWGSEGNLLGSKRLVLLE